MIGVLLGGLARAFPTEDAAAERSVLATPSALSRGQWSLTEAGLSLAAPAPPTSFWLAPEGQVADGLVRARIRRGAKVDCTVLFRASADPRETRDLSSYGLSIEPERVRLYRWDLGEVRALSEPVPLDLAKHANLEVVVLLVGAQIVATVYDADTLALLATVTARDGALVSGAVGFRAHDEQSADTRLTHLAVQPAGALHAPERFPFGNERLFRLPADERSLVPEDLDIAREQRDGDGTWLLTDALGLERLRRVGLHPIGVTSETPWWIYDPSYFAARGRAPVRTATGFDLGLSYKSPQMVEALLKGWHALYPDVTRLEKLGTTTQGRALWALRVTDRPDEDEGEPVVLLNGAHHGDELPSVEYVLDAIGRVLEQRSDGRVARWVSELDLWFVPIVNPDGAHMFLEVSTAGGRRNARDRDGDGVDPFDGVDLNRNYPFRWGQFGEVGSSEWDHHGWYRGPSPASEPETRAMIALAKRVRPTAVLSFHTNATTILSPYTIDGVGNPEPDEAWALALAMAEAAGPQPKGRQYKVRRKLYTVDGTDQDWHRFTHGSAAFIVEGSDRAPKDAATRHGTVAGVRGITATLLDRVADGPRVSGTVTDAEGNPLEAEVRIEEVALQAGERWTSRAEDGRFHRLLPGPGTYTIVARLDGYGEVRRAVEVTGVEEVELVLADLAVTSHPPRAD